MQALRLPDQQARVSVFLGAHLKFIQAEAASQLGLILALGLMTDSIVITAYWAILALPVAIYSGSKVSLKIHHHAYSILGASCIALSIAFAAFVFWYFMQTGNVVFPGKDKIPARIVSWADSPSAFLLTVSATLTIFVVCVWVGVYMLRLGARPNSSSKRTREKPRAA